MRQQHVAIIATTTMTIVEGSQTESRLWLSRDGNSARTFDLIVNAHIHFVCATEKVLNGMKRLSTVLWSSRTSRRTLPVHRIAAGSSFDVRRVCLVHMCDSDDTHYGLYSKRRSFG